MLVSVALLSSAANASGWQVATQDDDFTGKSKTYISVESKSTNSKLFIECRSLLTLDNGNRSPNYRISFGTRKFLGEGDLRSFAYRVDDRPIEYELWTYGSNQAEFTPNSDKDVLKSVAIAKAMVNSRKLLVRATTYRQEHIEEEFVSEGGQEALSKLTETCTPWPR